MIAGHQVGYLRRVIAIFVVFCSSAFSPSVLLCCSAQRRLWTGLAGVPVQRVLAQKVEVAAAIGLQDFTAVETRIAPLGDGRWRDRTARYLFRRHQEVEATLGNR